MTIWYPQKGRVDKDLAALAVYSIGKPIVIEETFPLSCSMEELDQFLEGSQKHAHGWISHYFGRTIEEHQKGAEPSGKLVAEFLEYWRKKGTSIQEPRTK